MNEVGHILGNDFKICLARELTKRHETVINGNAAEIINYLNMDKNHLKGEFVILLRRQTQEESPYKNLDLDGLINELLREVKPSIASKIASRLLNIDKSICYEKAIRNKDANC